jgi:LysM repeat protein
MVARNPARYLAPVALVAIVAGVYLVVHHNQSPPSTPPVVGHARPKATRRKYAGQQYYVVQQGDVLSRISQKTGIPITTLESLNPNIAPNSLQVGQRIRLRR